MQAEKIAKISLCSMRVLQVNNILKDHTAGSIRTILHDVFSKDYSIKQIERACSELITLELLSEYEKEDEKHYIITQKGHSVVRKVQHLSLHEPDPWRKYTRPSYSPNVVAHNEQQQTC